MSTPNPFDRFSKRAPENPSVASKRVIDEAEARYADAQRAAAAAKQAADAAIAEATKADQIAKAKADAQRAEFEKERARIELEALKSGGVPTTVEQGKAASFYTRMLSSEQAMSKMGLDPDSLIGKTAYELAPGLTAKVSSSERTTNRDYVKNFLMASLRKESGAVIAPFELSNQYSIYFPSADASPEEIEAKRQQRILAIENMRAEAGPAAIKADAALLKQGFVPFGMETATETPKASTPKEVVAGAGAETTTIKVPDELQQAMIAYVDAKGKDLDWKEYQSFFNNVAKQYNFNAQMPDEDAKSTVEAIKGGARYGGIQPPERPLTEKERTVSEALLSAPGAAATGLFNAATLGIPAMVNENIGRSVEGIRDENGLAFGIGDIAGNVAMTTLGGSALNALTRGRLGDVAADLAYSGITGATGAEEGERTSGAVTNAVISSLGGFAPSVVKSVLKPSTDEDIRILREAGVRLTPMQTVGGRANRVEEAASRMLIGGGDVGIAARKRAFNDFNTAYLNQAGKYIGFQLPNDLKPQQRMKAIGEAFDNQYDNIRSQMSVAPDADLAKDIADLESMITDGVTFSPENAARLKKLLDDQLKRRTANPIDGKEYKSIQSLLGKRQRSFAQSGNQELSEGVQAMRDILDNAARRRSPPEVVQALDNTDRGFAMLAQAQEAARMAGSMPGEFTPAQILSRQRAADTRARSRAFVEGDMEGQQLAEAGQRVLGNVEPSSGTTERLGAGLAVTGGSTFFSPWALVPNAAIGAMNAPGVRDVLPKVFAGKRPAPVEGLGTLMEKYEPTLQHFGSATAQQFSPSEQTPEDYAKTIIYENSPTAGAQPAEIKVSALPEQEEKPVYDPETDTFVFKDGSRIKPDGTPVPAMARGGIMHLMRKYA